MICPHCQQEHTPSTRYCPTTGKEIVLSASNHRVSKNAHINLGALVAVLLGGAALVAAGVMIMLKIIPGSTAKPQDFSPVATIEPAKQTETSRIVYTSNKGGTANIFLYDLADGSIKQLTNSVGENWSPAWSGDGKKIVFTSNRDGDSEIFMMNADGSSQINLTQNTVEDAFPDWSSDSSQIVFESMRDGNNEIYVMNADGSRQTRLTNYPDLDGLPAWSPDGSRIAFTRAQDGNTEIWVMNADGSGQTQLTNNPANDNSATWSPDGSLIGFDSDRDGRWEFYTMNPDGSNLTRVTNNIGYYGYADWAPDLEYITYTADKAGDLNIGVMTTSGAGVTILIDSPDMEVESQWSQGYVPGIHADLILPSTPQAVDTPNPSVTPLVGYTPDTLPSQSKTLPFGDSDCNVQSGTWTAWSGNEFNLTITIEQCKFKLIYMLGTFNGQWLILSHELDEPINGSNFDFTYNFDEANKYQLSGTFTSEKTANMNLLFFGPFKYSDTGMFKEDTLFELTATVSE